MEKLRIVFMGTPDFAVGILDAIYQSQYELVGVVTVADKPAGRGQKIKHSAVKEYAQSKGLPLLQPTNLKSEEFLTNLNALQANLFVVVAFRMLPEVVWKLPKYGTFNLHASLLPQYRGAAPINWAIINGEKQTGVTTFFIDDKIDTGAIILNESTAISANETAGELHDRLMHIGAEVVIKTLHTIAQGNVTTQKQIETTEHKTAYKLNKDNCKIDWSKKGKQIHDQIRGLSPYPTAWTFLSLNNEVLAVKIYESNFIEDEHQLKIGTVITTKKQIKVAVNGGFIEILSLQLPAKKRVKSHELVNGVTFSEETHVF